MHSLRLDVDMVDDVAVPVVEPDPEGVSATLLLQWIAKQQEYYQVGILILVCISCRICYPVINIINNAKYHF